MTYRTVSCSVAKCNKKFKNNSGLAAHMRFTHRLNRDGSNFTKDSAQIESRPTTITYEELNPNHSIKEMIALIEFQLGSITKAIAEIKSNLGY